MDTSCSGAVAAQFDRALALLHNFWYVRAFERFNQVAKTDPECAMAYWGAAMTYNHPFWDPPSPADETAVWALVQKGLVAQHASAREKLYLTAVAALYSDAGAGTKSERDQQYRDAVAAVYARYPDDETKLFYGLSILGAIQEGSKGFEQQGQAAKSSKTCTAGTRTIQVRCTISSMRTTIPSTPHWVSKRLGLTQKRQRPCHMLSTCRRTFSRDWATGMSPRRRI
jgi:hypothetical protein